jgi:hypothetical protein
LIVAEHQKKRSASERTKLKRDPLRCNRRAARTQWSAGVIRKWNFVPIVVSACLVSATSSHALSLQDRLSAWAGASDAERLEVSRVLALVASQGLAHFDEEFFQSCIDFASTQSTLQPRKIGEIGAMCVAKYLKLSEQKFRP